MNVKLTTPVIYMVSLLLFSGVVEAQQVPQFTQYRLTGMVYNPAYCGSQEGINIEGAFRAQWLGLSERPLTQSLGVHVPMPVLRSGVGVSVINDVLGLERKTSVYLNYAYMQPIKRDATLSVGVQGGVIQRGWRGDKFISPEGNYEQGGINHNDNFIPAGSEVSVAADVNFGIMYRNRNISLGASVLHLLQPSNTFTWANNRVLVVNKRHYLVSAAYDFEVNRIFTLSPSLLVKTDLIKYQLDAGVVFTYDRLIQTGIALRGYESKSFDAVAISAGVNLGNKWLVSYSYDIGISQLRNFNSGSHELIVHYRISNFVSVKEGKTIYNPRFM